MMLMSITTRDRLLPHDAMIQGNKVMTDSDLRSCAKHNDKKMRIVTMGQLLRIGYDLQNIKRFVMYLMSPLSVAIPNDSSHE